MYGCRDVYWLFILATGRSGSTTVMTQLNLLPFVALSGENMNLVGHFFDMLHPPSSRRHGDLTRNAGGAAFKRIVDHQAQVDALCASIAALRGDVATPPALIRGFKEIRHTPVHVLHLASMLPTSKFIFNMRVDTAAQAASAFYRHRNGTEALNAIMRSQEQLEEIAARLPSHRQQTITTEDFSVEKFNDLRRWLGVHNCTFTKVLHMNYNGTYWPRERSMTGRRFAETVLQPSAEHCTFQASQWDDYDGR